MKWRGKSGKRNREGFGRNGVNSIKIDDSLAKSQTVKKFKKMYHCVLNVNKIHTCGYPNN